MIMVSAKHTRSTQKGGREGLACEGEGENSGHGEVAGLDVMQEGNRCRKDHAVGVKCVMQPNHRMSMIRCLPNADIHLHSYRAQLEGLEYKFEIGARWNTQMDYRQR